MDNALVPFLGTSYLVMATGEREDTSTGDDATMPAATTGQTCRRGSLFSRVALAACALGAALLIAEIAVRRFVPAEPSMRFGQLDSVLAGQDRHQLMKLIENDAQMFWRLAPEVTLPDAELPLKGVISNAERLREDHAIGFAKPAGQIRMLFVGDSVTFGYGLSHEETFVEQAEALLATRYPQLDIECINAGVPGYTLFQGRQFLRQEGWSYQPDLVVMQFGLNDAVPWDGLSDAEHHAHLQSTRSTSRLAELLYAAAARPQKKPESKQRPRLTPEEFRTLLSEVHRDAERRNIDLLLMVPPTRYDVSPERIENNLTPFQYELYQYGQKISFGPAGEYGYFDAIGALQSMTVDYRPEEIFLDDVHPTALANARIATALVKKLDPWLRDRAKGVATKPLPQVVDLDGQTFDPLGAPEAKAVVLLFVRADCPISNRYAPEIRRLHAEYGSRGVAFNLVYVDADESPDVIRKHTSEYDLPVRALRDPGHRLVRGCGATKTPEAVVFAGHGKQVYRGRIDNWYVDYGQPRPAPTVRDLEQVLKSILAGESVEKRVTAAVGCPIEPLE